MELKLDISKLQQLYYLGITPTQFVYLWAHVDHEVLVKTTPLDHTNLVAKGYLYERIEEDNVPITEITQLGHELIEKFLGQTPIKIGYADEFNIIYELYPFSDKYGSYPRTRTLRTNSKAALEAYIAARQNHSFETIKKALENEIEFRADATNNGTTNSFKFMKSLNNWLTSEEFTVYINMEKETFRKLYGKDIE